MKFLTLINRLIQPLKKVEDPSKFKNILVVSNSGLGDTLLSTPAIASLRRSYHDISITFLVNEKMYPLFKGLEFVDDFLMYSAGVFSQIKLIKKLREKKIDTIFLFHSNGPEDIFFSVLSGAPNILKMTYDNHHEFSGMFYNESGSHSKHNIENKLNMVKLFGVKNVITEMQVPTRFYKQFGYFKKDKRYTYIGLQIGTQDLYKMWPITKFIDLIDFVNSKYSNTRFVLFGSTKLEIELSEKLMSVVNKPDTIINICGSTAIDELPVAVNDLDFIITGDTGILHLAIALKKRTISLFGPTDCKEYGPYQDTDLHSIIQVNGRFVNSVPKKKRGQEGMDIIEVERVINKLDKLMVIPR